MKTILLFALTSLICLGSFCQNNPPVAVDDRDTLIGRWGLSNSTYLSNKIFPLSNDYDIDSNQFYIDTAYSVLGRPISYSPALINLISYNKVLGIGNDTIYYKIKDNGTPSLSSWGKILIYYEITKAVDEDTFKNANISAILNSYGDIFRSSTTFGGGYFFPNNQNTSIYSFNAGISGKSDTNYYSSYYAYLKNPFIDLYPGPVGVLNNYTVYDELKWNKVWSVTDWDIQFHRNNWMNSGYIAHSSILEWPAHGDTTLGHAYYLAPFIDFNNDGKYNPYDGDYPASKGQVSHYLIQSENIGGLMVERHYLFYGYNCLNNEIKSSSFLLVKYFNRSNTKLDSSYITLWSDFDLGCSTNDYVGTDVIRNTGYVYNGSPFDQDCNGAIGYQSHIPIQTMTIVKGAKVDNDNVDNSFGINRSNTESVNGLGFSDGTTDNEYWGMSSAMYYNVGGGPTGDPNTYLDYFNYSRGVWRDGTNLEWGGTGHNTGNGKCHYMFPHYSDTIYWYGTNGVSKPLWNEMVLGNPAGDRRLLISSGPFTLPPSGEMEVEMAFVTAIDSNASGLLGSLPLMEQYVDSLHSYYRRNKLPCGGNFTEVQEQNFVQQSFNVVAFPNPTKGIININYESELDATAKLFDMYGKLIVNSTIKEGISQLDIRQLSNGIYFLNVTNTHHSKTIKVIKN